MLLPLKRPESSGSSARRAQQRVGYLPDGMPASAKTRLLAVRSQLPPSRRLVVVHIVSTPFPVVPLLNPAARGTALIATST